MEQRTKSQIATELTNRYYYANGAQRIMGIYGKEMFEIFRDSVTWYDERFNGINFPFVIEAYASTVPVPAVTGKYYIQGWETDIASSSSVNGEYESVVEYDGSIWQQVAELNPLKDYFAYVKGVSPLAEDEGDLWLYDNRKDVGDKWLNVGRQFTMPHNNALYKQGGDSSASEFYHVTLDQFNAIGIIDPAYHLNDTIIGVYDEIADLPSVVGYPAFTIAVVNFASSSTTKAKFYYVNASVTAWTDTGAQFTTRRLEMFNQADYFVYFYNKNTEKVESKGRNYQVNHNYNQNIQGGTTGERYHLTSEQHSLIDTPNYSFYFNETVSVKRVVDTIANIPVAGYTPIAGDYAICYLENAADLTKMLYAYNGTNWILSYYVFDLTKRWEVYCDVDDTVYFFNTLTKVFVDKGANYLTKHNAQHHLQGGDLAANEFYHLDADTYNSLAVIVVKELIVYVAINGPAYDPALPNSTTNRFRTSLQSEIASHLAKYSCKKLTFDVIDDLTSNPTLQTTWIITSGSGIANYIIKQSIDVVKFIGHDFAVGAGGIAYAEESFTSNLTKANILAGGPDSEMCYNIEADCVGGAKIDGAYFLDGGDTIALIRPSGLSTYAAIVDYERMVFAPKKKALASSVKFKQNKISVDISALDLEVYQYIVVEDCDLHSNESIVCKGLSIDRSATYIANIITDKLSITNSYLNVPGTIDADKTTISSGIILGDVVNSIYMSVEGLVKHTGRFTNKGLIENITAADYILTFSATDTSLFNSIKGSVIMMSDLDNLLLINPDNFPFIGASNSKFNNVLKADNIECVDDNDESYIVKTPIGSISNIYNSEDNNLDTNIGLLQYFSNKSHYREDDALITFVTPSFRIPIAHFDINTFVKIKFSAYNVSDRFKHYYKDIHVALTGVDTIEMHTSGLNLSSLEDANAAEIFEIDTSVLYLRPTVSGTDGTFNIDVEIERTIDDDVF